MLHKAGERPRSGAWLDSQRSRAVIAMAGLGIALGSAYFLAALLGLALLREPAGVPVLWPASGIAAGVLMVLGRGARAGVVLGVIGATVAANLLGDRNLWASLSFGLCNAGEAVLAASLVERWSGQRFPFDELRRLWGFLAAAALAAAAAAAVAALAMRQFHLAAPLLGLWRNWATADALGIVMVAPLVVGLHHLAREPPPRAEVTEGLAALALLAAASAALYTARAGSWLSEVPPAVLFPLLLWIAARSRPVFAAAAAFVIAGVLAGAATLHLGPFAKADIPIVGVQVTMLVASLCALTLAALFAERRRTVAALMESNDRLQLALSGAQLGVWCVDLATSAFENDARDRQINGHDPANPPHTLTEVRKYVYPPDLVRLDKAFAAARRTGDPCRAEYRVRGAGKADAQAGAHTSGQIRWVAVEGNVARDAAGRPVRLLGVTRDITAHKLAEAQKDLLLAELDHRVKNALAVVAAVASRTQETSASLGEFVAALDGRIKSMANAHELLSGRKWQGIRLAELIARELQPYATGRNVRIDGPDVVLHAEAGQAVAMAVHELVTNAAKYGALSVERGRVSVQWTYGSGAGVVLDWVETGGPPVAAGERSGYGTSVITDLVPYELGGTVDLNLAPDGVRCRLQIPPKWMGGDALSDRVGRHGAGVPPPDTSRPRQPAGAGS
jgi:two-component sensor histidine kinase/integral membrane sensor domain MASE1